MLDRIGRSNKGIRVDPDNSNFMLGDSKARNNLKWKPKIGFQELVRIMTEYDLELAEREAHALQFHRN